MSCGAMTEYMGRNGIVGVPGTYSQDQTHTETRATEAFV
jgi:hypothetical protein